MRTPCCWLASPGLSPSPLPRKTQPKSLLPAPSLLCSSLLAVYFPQGLVPRCSYTCACLPICLVFLLQGCELQHHDCAIHYYSPAPSTRLAPSKNLLDNGQEHSCLCQPRARAAFHRGQTIWACGWVSCASLSQNLVFFLNSLFLSFFICKMRN